MPLTTRVVLNPEVRVARAQSFYADAQQRKLANSRNNTKPSRAITTQENEHPDRNNSSSPEISISDSELPIHPADPQDIKYLSTALVANKPEGPVTMTEPEAPAATTAESTSAPKEISGADDLKYIQYSHQLEAQYLPKIRALISKDLSEPYSIYVYRYFLYQWGHLCYMALDPTTSSLIGVVICKLEPHASHSPATFRGYIAMLAVSSPHRGKGIATKLVRLAIDTMADKRADEIVLETEESNIPAMRLYERLGFLRSKKLHRYYLNGSSAYRLVLSLQSVGDDDSGETDEDLDRAVAPKQIFAFGSQ